MTAAGAIKVRIVREDRGGDGWSVYDGEEWFAHSTTITDALHYASDLLHGPGVGPRGSVWNHMRAIEQTRKPSARELAAALSDAADSPECVCGQQRGTWGGSPASSNSACTFVHSTSSVRAFRYMMCPSAAMSPARS